MQKGYLSKVYASTYKPQGQLRRLYNGNDSGYVLERNIPSTAGYKDLCSLYPVFPYYFPLDHYFDFLIKEKNLISLLIVTDPLIDPIETDGLYKYKDHSIVQLQKPFVIHHNHSRNIKKALTNNVEVKHVILTDFNINEYSNKFTDLYSVLVKRHNITGFSNFSGSQLLTQLKVPGTVLLEALKEGKTLGFIIFYIEGNNVRYHLGCYTDEGYNYCSSYLLMYEGMNYFRQLGYENLVLGGSSGSGEKDGLNRFKSGWTQHYRPNFIYFKLLQPEIYAKLCEGKLGTNLPLYR